jgi:hypothetical protein
MALSCSAWTNHTTDPTAGRRNSAGISLNVFVAKHNRPSQLARLPWRRSPPWTSGATTDTAPHRVARDQACRPHRGNPVLACPPQDQPIGDLLIAQPRRDQPSGIAVLVPRKPRSCASSTVQAGSPPRAVDWFDELERRSVDPGPRPWGGRRVAGQGLRRDGLAARPPGPIEGELAATCAGRTSAGAIGPAGASSVPADGRS